MTTPSRIPLYEGVRPVAGSNLEERDPALLGRPLTIEDPNVAIYPMQTNVANACITGYVNNDAVGAGIVNLQHQLWGLRRLNQTSGLIAESIAVFSNLEIFGTTNQAAWVKDIKDIVGSCYIGFVVTVFADAGVVDDAGSAYQVVLS